MCARCRAPASNRSSVLFSQVEQQIRGVIPANQLDLILDDIGLPQDPISFTFGFTPNIGAFDGEILVSLNRRITIQRRNISSKLRKVLPKAFPSMTFYFEPADMVTRILDFGVTAPIDVQVQGTDDGNFDVARDLRDEDCRDTRCSRCSSAAGDGQSYFQDQCGSDARGGVWIDAAGCIQQPVRLHGIGLCGRAKLLGRPEDEPHLYGYGADAAVSSRLAQPAWRTRRSPSRPSRTGPRCWATWPRSRLRTSRWSSTITMCSASTTCCSTRRTRISERSRRSVQKIVDAGAEETSSRQRD